MANCCTTGTCDQCSPISIKEEFCVLDTSEIRVTPSCGCNLVTVDLCKMYTNGKFQSSDDSIEITTYPLPSDNSQCGLDFTFNGGFYLVGESGAKYKVFCPDPANPNNYELEIEGNGIDVRFEPASVAGCYKLILDSESAALAKGLKVGCTTDTDSALGLVQNPSGFIKMLFNCAQFDITTSKSTPSLDEADTITINSIRDSIATINGGAPDSNGDFTVTGTAPITVTTTGNNADVALDYDTQDFELSSGNLKLITKSYAVKGSASSPVNIDTRLESASTPFTSDPNWSAGGTTMTIWEKKISLGGTVTIPYNAPAGYIWALDITLHAAAYPLPPSSGAGSTIPSPSVVQGKAYVNNSLVSDYSGQQRESNGYVQAPGQPSRGDINISGFFTDIPQASGDTVNVELVVQYNINATHKDNMDRVEFGERSYSGQLILVKEI